MYIDHDGNKKQAAHLSGVGVRRVQKVVKEYQFWLDGYKCGSMDA